MTDTDGEGLKNEYASVLRQMRRDRIANSFHLEDASIYQWLTQMLMRDIHS
jgi:hypothetical protein